MEVFRFYPRQEYALQPYWLLLYIATEPIPVSSGVGRVEMGLKYRQSDILDVTRGSVGVAKGVALPNCVLIHNKLIMISSNDIHKQIT